MDKWVATQEKMEAQHAKQVCYMSMEFLLGRSLRNNVYNLGLMEPVQEALKEIGTDFETICNLEQDAALGNGGRAGGGLLHGCDGIPGPAGDRL